MTATAPPKDVSKSCSLPSGGTLHLGRPSYAAAARLRNALARAAGGRPFTAEEMKLGLDDLAGTPSAGGALVSRLLTVLASDEVEEALFACLAQSTYEPAGGPGARIKINRDLLDHADFGDAAREDLYPIFLHAGEAALRPFLKALVSAYMEFLKTRASVVPRSKSSSPPNVS